MENKRLFVAKINLTIAVIALLVATVALSLTVYARGFDHSVPHDLCEEEGFHHASYEKIPFTVIKCSNIFIKENGQILYETKDIPWWEQ